MLHVYKINVIVFLIIQLLSTITSLHIYVTDFFSNVNSSNILTL